MLSQFVGQVDANSAFVLIAIVACIGIIVTSIIVKRRSRLDINNEHELAKMKIDASNQRELYVVETDRAYKFKQLDKNLITSHKEESEQGRDY